MMSEGRIYHIFCFVDDQMGAVPKHPHAKLDPSELVMIVILFALKGQGWRAFFCWLKRDWNGLFSGLQDESRLRRALVVHQDWCDALLAEPNLFTVMDSLPD
jgi:hypothetical protein